MASGATGPLNYDALADRLSALAYSLRLELLDRLRFPHSIGELRLSPRRREGGKVISRPAARQTIQGHLNQLIEAGLVDAEPAEEKSPNKYIVNAARLYEITEQMRRLSVRYAGRARHPDETGTMAPDVLPPAAQGPRLVLVHGLYEGKSFALDASKTAGQWSIGRRSGAEILLEYDPFVSLDHAVVTGRDGRYTLTDLGSKNGTTVNWAALPRSGSHVLRPADVIGVGRSLLVFAPGDPAR